MWVIFPGWDLCFNTVCWVTGKASNNNNRSAACRNFCCSKMSGGRRPRGNQLTHLFRKKVTRLTATFPGQPG